MRTYVGRGVGAHIENKLLSAKKYLLVCSPWIHPEYASKLIGLSKQGVAIRIITSDSEEKWHQQSLDMFDDALTPPRRIFGFRKKQEWVRPPIELMVVSERFIHAKMYIVDGEYAVVGSPNLTQSGLWQNVEYVLIFEGEEAKQIEDDFQTLWRIYAPTSLKVYEYDITPPKGILQTIIEKVFRK